MPSYREARRVGVGLERGDAAALAALIFAGGDSSGYFFVLGQIRRHGCDFKVAVASLTLSALVCREGPSEVNVDFNFSDEVRKFCNVTVMLSFFVKSPVISFKLISELERALSGPVS